jgi:ectoine hydroxylase-related dioxygenase (phytanoyl-CoA dioxygenase family)
MPAPITHLDFDRLERDGFVIVPGLVLPEELATFEREIALVGEQLATQRGIERRSGEAIADVLVAAGRHRPMLFDHVKRLFCLARLSVEIGTLLEQAGLFRQAGIAVPIVWPTLRADLPGEGTYELPLHQDYATTRCRMAWRMWIPLRGVDRHHGTMEVISGSHRGAPYPYVQEARGSPSIEPRTLAERGLSAQSLDLSAGDGLIFSPWLVHGSVPNRSARTKWVLLLHVQDLTTFVNPDEPADPVYQFLELTERGRAPSRATGGKQ